MWLRCSRLCLLPRLSPGCTKPSSCCTASASSSPLPYSSTSPQRFSSHQRWLACRTAGRSPWTFSCAPYWSSSPVSPSRSGGRGFYKLLLLLKTVAKNNLNYISNQPRNGSCLIKHGAALPSKERILNGSSSSSWLQLDAAAHVNPPSAIHSHCGSSSPSNVRPTFSISSGSHDPLKEKYLEGGSLRVFLLFFLCFSFSEYVKKKIDCRDRTWTNRC